MGKTNNTLEAAIRGGLGKYPKECALMLVLLYKPYAQSRSFVTEQAYYADELGISVEEFIKRLDNLGNAGLVTGKTNCTQNIVEIRIKKYHDIINLDALKESEGDKDDE